MNYTDLHFVITPLIKIIKITIIIIIISEFKISSIRYIDNIQLIIITNIEVDAS
jgi:hypothetical protein